MTQPIDGYYSNELYTTDNGGEVYHVCKVCQGIEGEVQRRERDNHKGGAAAPRFRLMSCIG